MNKILLVLALAFGLHFTVSAQNPSIDNEQLEEQFEMMQSQMSKLFEQLGSGMEDGKFFFIDTTFADKYRNLEFDDLDENGELSPDEFGKNFEMLSKMMMQDLLKMTEGMKDFPLFQELQPLVPAPNEQGNGTKKSEQSDKMKKKRVVKTL